MGFNSAFKGLKATHYWITKMFRSRTKLSAIRNFTLACVV